ARRVIERQRGEGIQHAVVAGLAPVAGFDAENRHQVFARDLILGGDLLERVLVIEPEARALADALGCQEVIAVFPPRRHLLDGAVHRLDDLWLRLRFLQQGAYVLAVEAVAAHHLVDEFHDLGALQIEAGRGRVRRLRARRSAHERGEQRVTALVERHVFDYDPMSLRREYSDMRIPKPARSVTTELPP